MPGDAIRLAVVGAGMIGRRHAALVAADPGAILAAVVDPTTGGRRSRAGEVLAAEHGVNWYPGLAALLAADRRTG